MRSASALPSSTSCAAASAAGPNARSACSSTSRRSASSPMRGFRLARIEVHRDLIEAARDDAALILARDPTLTTPRGEALRHLLYLFERDEAIRLLRAG